MNISKNVKRKVRLNEIVSIVSLFKKEVTPPINGGTTS